MRRTKRLVAILLAAAALFMLAACGSDMEPNAVGSPVGEQIDHAYTNNLFLFRCDLPEDWVIASKEERLALIGLTRESYDNEDLDKMLERAGTWYELYASTPDDTARLSITVERAAVMNRIAYSPETLLDGNAEPMKANLEASGLQNVQSERGKKEIGGSNREYLLLSGEYEGKMMYIETFYIKTGSYFACMTLSSFGEDHTAEMESFFAPNIL